MSVHHAHLYPTIPDGEDKVSYKRNVELMEKELKEHHPSKAKLKDLMKRTFSERRKWIVSSALSARQVWTEFPLLKKTQFVSIIM